MSDLRYFFATNKLNPMPKSQTLKGNGVSVTSDGASIKPNQNFGTSKSNPTDSPTLIAECPSDSSRSEVFLGSLRREPTTLV